MPLGIIAKKDIIALNEQRTYENRANLQKQLYDDFFGTRNAVKSYGLESATCNNLTVEEQDGKYVLTPKGQGSIEFKIPISANITLYFNAFDENTNALNQSINGKFNVSSPKVSTTGYPKQRENGLLNLGEYTRDEASPTVKIKVTVTQKVTIRELGIVAIEKQALGLDVRAAKTVGLTAGKSSLSGTYEAKGGECVFLSIAYDSGMRLRINGKKAELYEVYDGFTAFYLEEGINEIELSYTPDGFVLGTIISVLGIGACALLAAAWIWKKRTIKVPKKAEEIVYVGMIVVGVIVAVIVYMVPILLCAIG